MSPNVRSRLTSTNYKQSKKKEPRRSTPLPPRSRYASRTPHRRPHTGRSPPGRLPRHVSHGLLLPRGTPRMDQIPNRADWPGIRHSPPQHKTTPLTIRRQLKDFAHSLPHGSLPTSHPRGGLCAGGHIQTNLELTPSLSEGRTTRPRRGTWTQYPLDQGGLLRGGDPLLDTSPRRRGSPRHHRQSLSSNNVGQVPTLAP
jgi:hypothetical protein